MTLVSVTLADNRELQVARCVRSAAKYCDVVLIIDTGITDRTLLVASEFAGEKLRIESFPWTGSFADARNFALKAASKYGDWAFALDTDEWIVPHQEVEGACLGSIDAEADVLLVESEKGWYLRERLFKLPTEMIYYVGPTHEAVIGAKMTAKLGGLRVYETPKTPEELRKKFERDVTLLEPYARDRPRDPRWWYYLGDALANLGRRGEARVCFEKCGELPGWDEQAAWAWYRRAVSDTEDAKWQDAIRACAMGLSRHPGIAELAWLAGYCSLQTRSPKHAIQWAKTSLAIGYDKTRIGFRHLPALYEGPYDVMRWAYDALGDHANADSCRRECERRLESRLALK